MNAVGKLRSYIGRGVYTVSGPFHPFGGAVDIVVVEQQDGTFKSSPWYVRFGKFQGVLKAKEKVVGISVNGIEADFQMYLDHKGEAHFLRELDVEEHDALLSSSSSGDDTDEQTPSRMPLKSHSCNYDAYVSDSVTQIDISSENVLARSNSHRSRILGLVFGRKSMKEDKFLEGGNDAGVVRTESLERAQIAADLLEVKWSTNLASSRHRKDSVSRLSSREISEDKSSKDLLISDRQDNIDSLVHDNMVNKLGDDTPLLRTGLATDEKGLIVDNVAKIANRMDVISQFSSSESQIEESVELELHPVGRSQKGQDFDETCHIYPNSSLWMHEEETSNIAPFLYCETSTSSTFELDASDKETAQTLCLSNGVCEQILVETLQTAGLVCEMTSPTETSLNVEEPSSIQEIAEKNDKITFSNDGKSPESTGIFPESMKNGFVTETYSQIETFQPAYGSVQNTDSQNIFTISAFSNPTCRPLVEKDIREKNETARFDHPLEPVTGPKVSFGDPVQSNVLQPESLEEEQLLFGDLDDFKGNEPRNLKEPISQHNEKESDVRLSLANGSFILNDVSYSSADCSGLDDLPHDAKDLTRKLKSISSECNIPATSRMQSKEVARTAKSLPNMWTHNSGLCALDLGQSSEDALDPDSNTLKPVLLKKDILSNIKENADGDHQLPKTPYISEDAKNVGKLKNGQANIIIENSFRSFDASDRSWRVWSFPFKRSRSKEVSQLELNCNESSDVETIKNRKEATENKKEMPKMKPSKKKTSITTPTSEQLASLNLKQGRNTVAFTFSTPMLGKQQVDAVIYLWKWDARIVISDVDGTITRSDLLGQVMPLVGVDWSQTGVAHLFSDIKENGYQMLFLSARAISQAYHTRQFLFNLKQDGKALPEGPVVISPDGLFPSLYREVVRRAPHEFKISCLEAIKALFPSDRNPFYAGFGNRDTDEISYLKVGIPKGKIFIINPKGEIVVNHCVETKSYTSLHALVHDIFPPMSSSEQEDFNSWNYWKLPPPAIDV